MLTAGARARHHPAPGSRAQDPVLTHSHSPLRVVSAALFLVDAFIRLGNFFLF